MNVSGAAQPEGNHAGNGGGTRDRSIRMKAAGPAVSAYGSKAIGVAVRRGCTGRSQFKPNVLAAMCSRRVDVNLMLEAVNRAARTSCRYASDKTVRVAAPLRPSKPHGRRTDQGTSGRLSARAIMSLAQCPCLGQIQRDGIPGTRFGQVSILHETIRDTVVSLPETPTTTRSPVAMLPRQQAEKPRKSRFGRFTHCTGKRNGFLRTHDRRPNLPDVSSSVDRCPVHVLGAPCDVVTRRADIGNGVMERNFQ